MSQPVRSQSESSQHSDNLRKRVGKACDRCRLKKSKCDGTNPCTRCKADNAICVFGERKKSHDKVYPKGYVEMLEQQQSQLVAGLQETYRRLLAANIWPSQPLDEPEGHPLTHDILAALEIISPHAHSDQFEDDPDRLQQRLLSHGAPLLNRRGSYSSDSDHSTTHSHKRAISVVDSPIQSPVPRARKSLDGDKIVRTAVDSSPSSIPQHIRNAHKPSPLQTSSPMNDDTPAIDDDALLSSWSWQDLQSDPVAAQEPQFTFPNNSTYNYLDSWAGLNSSNQFDPTFMASYPAGLDMNYTNMQQLQKQPFDLTSYMPVLTS